MKRLLYILFAIIAAMAFESTMPAQAQVAKVFSTITKIRERVAREPKMRTPGKTIEPKPKDIAATATNTTRTIPPAIDIIPHIPDLSVTSELPRPSFGESPIRQLEQQIQAYDENFIRDLEKKGLLAVQQHQVLMQELQEIRRKYKPEEWLKEDYIDERWKIIQKYARQQARKHRETLREEMQEPPKEKASIKRPVTVEEMRLRPYSRLIKICGESAIKIWGNKENNRSLGDNVKQPTNDKDRYHNEALPVFDFAA